MRLATIISRGRHARLGELMFHCSCCVNLCVAVLPLLLGCQQVKKVLPKSTWHEKFEWKAEDFFSDPQVIALCRAIETNDLAEMDRLIAAGADINAQGKGKMTPLLWAFPDNQLGRFKKLLEHGANPNVIVEDDFGTRGVIMSGTSVTWLASGTTFPGYFDAVFAHGGDPNIEQETKALWKGDAPIFAVIRSQSPDKKQRIRLLIDKGADINHLSASYTTPTMLAAGWGGQFDIALTLLEAGADHTICTFNSNQRLIHLLITYKTNPYKSSAWTPRQNADYDALIRWLETHGESIKVAQEDLERWRSWSTDSGEYQRKMAAEVAARKAREAQAKQGRADADENAKM